MSNLSKLPHISAIPDTQLTHVGVFVRDIESMVDFYTRTLGLLLVDLGDMMGKRLAFLSRSANEHHQLVLAHDPERTLEGSSSLNQISFRMNSLRELSDYYKALLPADLPGMEGRHHGNSWSFYFFDPEGNKIEVYAVTEWQVQQPWRRPLDLSRPVEEIEAETIAILKEVDNRLLGDWQEEMRQRLAAQRTPVGA